ncbi:dienelactone hydrolase family protein [Chitinophaga sedimenti]|uniref:dienelactone hydrolase family protein n=1 Tax=Chitinophaga sedimenti TaxID=2033606 RepID=UPI00200656A5|nr:dienelactone hydrolase family protein [Chitinophaga sedimenti]MCK7555188.1 dienelactone hydrolase family protein [Chitinophaga sedimenti]
MKKQRLLFTALAAVVLGASACNNQPAKTGEDTTATTAPVEVKLKEETVTYKDDTTTLVGYVVYNENVTTPRPAVLVVPEWWGLNEYPKTRARQLAELGYIAIAVDMYGNGLIAPTPKEAGAEAGKFYTNPALMKSRIEAALTVIKSFKQTDTSRIAAIGYCFGGAVVLNVAKLGAPLKGVVSFHGNLAGAPANKDLLKAKILVCHGADDKFVSPEEIAAFRKGLDSIGADYQFIAYPGAVHAFTNPGSTEKGQQFNIPIAYNAAADTASWKDMKTFFGRIF